MYSSGTAKCRERLLRFCEGHGVDLGCGMDKIRPEAIGVDSRPEVQPDRVGSIEDLAWIPDGSLDYVFSSHALEHVPFPWRTLRTWLTKLKSGGHLVLYLPHKDLYGPVLAAQGSWNPEHLWNPTPELVKGMIEEAAGGRGLLVTFVHEYVDSGEDRYSFDLVARVEEPQRSQERR